MRLPRRLRPSTAAHRAGRLRLGLATIGVLATIGAATSSGLVVAAIAGPPSDAVPHGSSIPTATGAGSGPSSEAAPAEPAVAAIAAAVASALDRPAEAGDGTRAVRISTRIEEREETIPAPVELHDNDVLPVGELRVDEQGVDGLRHEIVEVILRDGIAVDERVVVATERPPEPTIASVGTSTSDGATRNWAALARCESGGDPTIVSASGRYHGLYQFDLPTWESVGGTGLPSEASPDEQRRRAIALYEQRGAGPWPSCGRHL